MARLKRISVSIGIFCHNEEENIARALTSVLASKTAVTKIQEIIVVSSGSFDRTNRIVHNFMKKDRRVRLIDEAERRGKSSAINLFLRTAKSRVLVSMSGDLKLKKDAIEELTRPFINPQVGMVGSHPIPLNARFSQVGSEAKLLWELHHLVSLRQVKCGEMIAFRNVILGLPADSSVDEATLEVLLKLIGFVVVYAPRAIVYNKVPLTRREFIMRRRTIETGHLHLTKRYNYQVSTMNQDILMVVLRDYLIDHPRELMTVLSLLLLEAVSRFLGWIDFTVYNKVPVVWTMAKR